MPDTEKIVIIKKWLGRTGLQLLETLTQAEKNVKQLSDYLVH